MGTLTPVNEIQPFKGTKSKFSELFSGHYVVEKNDLV